MKNKITLSVTASLLIGSALMAQQNNWVQKMHDPSVNFYETQKAFSNWNMQESEKTANKSASKSKMLKEQNDGEGAEGENERPGYEVYKTWEYFMAPRVYPSGDITLPSTNMERFKEYLSHRSAKKTPAAFASSWTFLGPTQEPANGGVGRVNVVRFDPTNTSIIYIGAPVGGLWKSTDAGSTWTEVNTDQLSVIGVSDVAIDPSNNQILYLATGDGDASDTYSAGVLKSTDGGATWNTTGLNWPVSNGYTINRLLINPSNPSIIYAGGSKGIYRSSNGGGSWTQVTATPVKSMEFQPGNPTIIYGCDKSFVRSTNNGLTFTGITSGLPSSGAVVRMSLAVSPANANYVYVVAADITNNGFYGMYRSTNGGTTFTTQDANSTPNLLGFNYDGSDMGGQGWYTLSIAVSPTNANEVAVGGVNIWQSTDGGVNWNLNADWTGTGAPYVHADIHNLNFLNGTTLFTGCDGGVFQTPDDGNTWNDIGNNLQIGEMYGLGMSATNAGTIISGWQDNGTNFLSGGSWGETLGGDGMKCFIDWSNDNNMFGEQYNGSLNKTTNGGASWQGLNIPTSETGAWVTPWWQDPNTSNTIYVGYVNMWKSTNLGNSWSQMGTVPGSDNVVQFAIAPSNSQVLYVVKQSGVYKTINGGTSWTTITLGLPAGAAAMTYVSISPTSANKAWVTFSGYSAGNKVFMTNDGGATWTNLSNGLPNLPVNCVVYQNGSPDGVYVGTDVGVYYKDSTLASFQPYFTGLPNVKVDQLAIYYPTSKLRAATYGRGIWENNLYNPLALPTAAFTQSATTSCAGNTVNFTDQSSPNPTSWTWQFSGGTPPTSLLQNPSVVYNTAGTYNVFLKVSNSNGADSITKNSVITINPDPAVPSITQAGNILTCTSTGLSYQWYYNGHILNGAVNQTYTFTTNGHYTVIVTNPFGCSATSPADTVIDAGIQENITQNSFSVFPNPNNGNFTLHFTVNKMSDYTIEIHNVVGQIVYKENLGNFLGTYSKQINLAGFGKGIYMLSLRNSNNQGAKKIIVY
ncbi:MAG: PKD domain-containing protein [Bacteroidia bacterium]